MKLFSIKPAPVSNTSAIATLKSTSVLRIRLSPGGHRRPAQAKRGRAHWVQSNGRQAQAQTELP